jgi:hypothetical protein
MKWSHLPLPGGIYAQHPDLIDGFEVIFQARSEYEDQEQKRRERESRAQMGGRHIS